MDLTVLDVQRTVLGQLYQTDSWRQNPENQNRSELHSVIDRRQIPPQLVHADCKPDLHCNSSFSANGEANNSWCPSRKRKAEFVVEDERKGNRAAEEAAAEEKSEITTKTGRGISCSKDTSKISEVQKPDYIHVRARRGQATDSHSLAERARREKISKKMKCLQDLVPGCNRVTGKGGMLDEIINYVQSLQKQVEFLSMKLAAVNPRLNFCIDSIFAKEIPTYIANLPAATQFESPNSNRFQYDTMPQGTSICGSSDMAIDQSQILSQKPGQNPEAFLDSSFIAQLQQLSGWESDWPSLFN